MAHLCSHGMTSGCIQCEECYGKSDPAQKRRELAERIVAEMYRMMGCAQKREHQIAGIERVLAEQEGN